MAEEPVRTQVGVLRVSTWMLGELLRLPAGAETVAVLRLDSGDLDVFVAGSGMPKLEHGQRAPVVHLIFRVETREPVPGQIEQRVLAHWDHSPAQEWLIRNWEEPEKPTPADLPF